MITAMTAILGLLPAALSTKIGAQTARPLAIVVVGGMVVTLVLDRYLMPALYSFYGNRQPPDAAANVAHWSAWRTARGRHNECEGPLMAKRWLTVLVFLFAFSVLASGVRGDDKARANAQARVEAARKVYNELFNRVKLDPNFRLSAETTYLWSRRWLEAQRELSDKKEDKVVAAADHLERMKKLRTLVTAQVKAGIATPGDAAAVDFYCLEAEHGLEQARGN
jgi:hypothetical protein